MDLDWQDPLKAIHDSPTYRLAEDDTVFMESNAARASRLALEFMRADLYLREQRINSTVVVFGSSRILAPEIARQSLDRLEHQQPAVAEVAEHARQVAKARTALAYSRYYEEARQLGEALAHRRGSDGHDFVVVTGGGPGIMEGANRGAIEAGGPSIGFNIRLPIAQEPNSYITPTLAFRFHYFALRKMHFLLRARALVAFPGGYGTLDELFESLNLVQSRTIHPIPIVLVGSEHWRRVVDFEFLVAEGLITESDRELLTVVDSGLEAAQRILDFYGAGL